ncbi:hypothetical protein L596_023875 [Steinernema carpocapsae]|uniref:Uncharacterized protein n=1 Tax=Steinernema carpocapsae TaxID=34508 RepID=A0A4U5MF02_STECR|nr:hypothetical protein L596_023875 [Steinernema carpocapsae]
MNGVSPERTEELSESRKPETGLEDKPEAAGNKLREARKLVAEDMHLFSNVLFVGFVADGKGGYDDSKAKQKMGLNQKKRG